MNTDDDDYPKDSQKRKLISTLAIATGAALVIAPTQAAPRITEKKQHWCMVIDLRKCVGCQACTVSCKIENHAPPGQFRTWVADIEVGQYPKTKRQFLPRLCNHCENPSCVPVCPTGATFKRNDGIVLINQDICWGCGACVTACPYDARFINTETKTADKCTFCAHRIEQGLVPACVETCVGVARVFGDLNDKESEVHKLYSEHITNVLNPATGNKPQVFYIGLNNEMTVGEDIKSKTWTKEFSDVFDQELPWVNQE